MGVDPASLLDGLLSLGGIPLLLEYETSGGIHARQVGRAFENGIQVLRDQFAQGAAKIQDQAGLQDLLQALAGCPGKVQRVLLVGHNPAGNMRPGNLLALPDGRVLIAGGSANAKSSATKAVVDSYLFDPKSNSFKAAGKMLAPRTGHRAVALDSPQIGVEEMKWIVLMVLINQPGQESAFAQMEDLVYNDIPVYLH